MEVMIFWSLYTLGLLVALVLLAEVWVDFIFQIRESGFQVKQIFRPLLNTAAAAFILVVLGTASGPLFQNSEFDAATSESRLEEEFVKTLETLRKSAKPQTYEELQEERALQEAARQESLKAEAEAFQKFRLDALDAQ